MGVPAFLADKRYLGEHAKGLLKEGPKRRAMEGIRELGDCQRDKQESIIGSRRVHQAAFSIAELAA